MLPSMIVAIVPSAVRSAMPRSRCNARLARAIDQRADMLRDRAHAGRSDLVAQVARVAVRDDQLLQARQQAEQQHLAPQRPALARHGFERARRVEQRLRGLVARQRARTSAASQASARPSSAVTASGIPSSVAASAVDAVLDRARKRQHHRELVLERADGTHARQDARGIEGQVHRKLEQLGEIGGEAVALAVRASRRGAAPARRATSARRPRVSRRSAGTACA